MPHNDADLVRVAQATPNHTGAELAALCNAASLAALREDINAAQVTTHHWEAALAQCPAETLTEELLERYDAFRRGVLAHRF